MPERPLVSFCFSTFKRKEFLKQTLESVFRQTVGNFEVIVSDNDPEQSASEIVNLFDERFRYFPNETNLGMKKSFNRSLERSTGEYIVMIADDDPVYPDMLDTLVTLAKEYPGFGMYMGGCDWLCTDPEVGRLYKFNVGTNSCLSNNHPIGFVEAFSPDEFEKKLFRFGIFPHYLWSTVIVKRDILVQIGGVPEYGTPFLGDYAYMSALAAISGCVTINKSLGCQTLHRENFGRAQNEQLVTAATRFPEYVKGKLSHLPDWKDIEPLVTRFTALWLVSHMSFLYQYNRKTDARDTSLGTAEKQVFQLAPFRRYRVKYYLKSRWPWLHDLLVKAKQAMG